MKKWIKYKNGNTVGEKGNENGIILDDEEYNSSGRITLEKCDEYYAITCGVYGAMVHTVFCSPKESTELFEKIKKDLGDFLSRETDEDEEAEFYDVFVKKY